MDAKEIGFHDAEIIDARRTESDLILSIEGAQYENYRDHAYNGLLHLNNIQSIKDAETIIKDFRKNKGAYSCCILGLDIIDNTVKMLVQWEAPGNSIYDSYNINSMDIYWEETGIFEW